MALKQLFPPKLGQTWPGNDRSRLTLSRKYASIIVSGFFLSAETGENPSEEKISQPMGPKICFRKKSASRDVQKIVWGKNVPVEAARNLSEEKIWPTLEVNEFFPQFPDDMALE